MSESSGDSDVSREELERGQVAFYPFVSAFGFSVNPEDVEEIIAAVLHHARSQRSLEEIDAAVRSQIARHMAGIAGIAERP